MNLLELRVQWGHFKVVDVSVSLKTKTIYKIGSRNSVFISKNFVTIYILPLSSKVFLQLEHHIRLLVHG